MTYQVLARKWRPKSFSDMAGQEHVLQTLVHALDNQRLHHAYLFTGTRGVGKTTIARIFARCLNCEEGVSSTPCGKCSACLEIGEGRFIDLIEVDAASKTKVEDTRELLENVQYAPSVGRYKVYLIDEVHMLSNHSFNALLKTLEEPPPHVVFLLATTDPHKLPVTILSRCLQFSLKNLSPQKIVEYLNSVLIAEQIPCEEGALWSIAKSAQGSMRDALTLLDQSISFCAGNVTEAEVSALLGTPDQALILRIVEALNTEDANELLETVSVIASRSFDYFLLLDSLLALLHRIAIAQLVPGGVDNSQGDREQIIGIAKKLTAEQVQLYYQIALNGRADMSVAFDARMAFEMLLLRMLVFSPQAPQSSALELADPVEPDDAPESQKKKPELNSDVLDSGSPQQPPSPAHSAETTPHNDELAETPAPALTPAAQVEPPAKGPTPAEDVPVTAELTGVPSEPLVAPQVDPEQLPVSASTGDETQVPPEPSAAPRNQTERWIQIVRELGITGITGNLLANCVLVELDETSVTLALDETQSALYNEEQGRRIEQVLREHFARPLKLTLLITAIDAESPAQFQQRKREEALEQARTEFAADEHIQSIISTFSAYIVPDSVSILREDKQ
jgi:DNA polymerase-3 subunit gamma/tau